MKQYLAGWFSALAVPRLSVMISGSAGAVAVKWPNIVPWLASEQMMDVGGRLGIGGLGVLLGGCWLAKATQGREEYW